LSPGRNVSKTIYSFLLIAIFIVATGGQRSFAEQNEKMPKKNDRNKKIID